MAAADSNGSSRFKDPRFINWLKMSQGLLILRDGLCELTDREANAFQAHLLQGGKTCGRAKCSNEEIKGHKIKTRCEACQRWVTTIAAEHVGGQIHWTNGDVQLWPSEAWEIAKVYMGYGQKSDNTGPSMTDCSGLLQLCCRCKRFNPFFEEDIESINDLLSERNNIMHSHSCHEDELRMKDCLQKMISLLGSNHELATIKGAQVAVQELKKLRDSTFVVMDQSWFDMESSVIRDRLQTLETLVGVLMKSDSQADTDELKRAVNALQQTTEYIKRYPDLHNRLKRLEASVGDIKGLVEDLKVESSTHTTQIQEVIEVTDRIEDKQVAMGASISDMDNRIVKLEDQRPSGITPIQDGGGDSDLVRLPAEVKEDFHDFIMVCHSNNREAADGIAEQLRQCPLLEEANRGQPVRVTHLQDVCTWVNVSLQQLDKAFFYTSNFLVIITEDSIEDIELLYQIIMMITGKLDAGPDSTRCANMIPVYLDKIRELKSRIHIPTYISAISSLECRDGYTLHANGLRMLKKQLECSLEKKSLFIQEQTVKKLQCEVDRQQKDKDIGEKISELQERLKAL